MRGNGCTSCKAHADSTFRVVGMDCHQEVALLERCLTDLDGVHGISADVLAQRLRVAHDAARVPVSAIAEAVAATGMRAWPEQSEAVAHGDPAATRRLALVIVSGMLIAAAWAIDLTGASRAWAMGLCLGAILAGGVYSVRRAAAAARRLSPDINVLMTVAVGGALALGEWFEAASVVFLFALAQWLEARSLDRARRAIRSLMDIAPDEVLVRRSGEDRRIPVAQAAVGDMMVVRPGERIALDGDVVAGASDVDQAPITGESVPAGKQPGDPVYAGSINGHGALDIRVTRLGTDSTIARIIHLVERAQASRAPTEAFVDRFARRYTPAVILLAAAVAVLPALAGAGTFPEWIYRALVLLVIACPCALVIATPVSVVSALSAAARHGVLVKGGAHLERTARVTCVALDKTGTLTSGRLAVTDVVPLDGRTPHELLATAAAIESRSEHPIGRAIVRHARQAGIAPAHAEAFRALPGRGAEAAVDGAGWVLGNHRLFEERGWCTDRLHDAFGALADRGRTAVALATAARAVGVFGVADEVRDGAAGAMAALRRQGIDHLVMLTGDGDAAAQALARRVGVDEVRAGLLPEEKVAAVEALRRRYGVVAMVGDGVNDAPALAAADLGIAMGAGTGAALETADVALMAGDLSKVPFLLDLARACLRTIKVNIAFALGIKAVFLTLAITGHATLWMAVLADTGASLVVVANALRLLRAR
jgi:Cd2+/Zn2+-exporting ATPase